MYVSKLQPGMLKSCSTGKADQACRQPLLLLIAVGPLETYACKSQCPSLAIDGHGLPEGFLIRVGGLWPLRAAGRGVPEAPAAPTPQALAGVCTCRGIGAISIATERLGNTSTPGFRLAIAYLSHSGRFGCLGKDNHW